MLTAHTHSCKQLQALERNVEAAWCPYNPHTPQFLTKIKRNFTIFWAFFSPPRMCGLLAHAKLLHELWRSIFRRRKQHAKKKRSLPTKQVSGKAPSREGGAKYSRRDSATGEGSHSSSVHRGIIPLSPPHTHKKNRSRYFSRTHAAANDLSVPPREVASPRTHGNLAELETERHNIQRTPSGQL